MSLGLEEKNVLINGININYKIIGEGEPFLILHGWSASSDSWVNVAEKLSQKGYKVIFPDFPGFGKSENPPKAWSVGDYTDWTLNFVNHFKVEKFILIGHSFGGRVAIKFSIYYPEKLKELILCGSAGLKLKPGIKAGTIRILAESGNVVFNFWIFKIFKNICRNIFYLFLRRYDYVKAKGVMRETMLKVIEEDLRPCLPKIKTKTLLVWGRKDKMVPLKCARIFKKNIKNSELKLLSGVGHGPHFETPEELVKIIIDFL